MKKQFPGHFKQTKPTPAAWGSSLFVFDTNILLNLYRYSDDTRDDFLGVLESLGDQVWLPHRVADEFLSQRLEAIKKQQTPYDDTISKINSLEGDFKSAKQHPFISKKTEKALFKMLEALREELNKTKKSNAKRVEEDEIQARIAKIFHEKVGQPYEKKKLDQIIADGEIRYLNKTPPGYKDKDKGGDSPAFSNVCGKYGDLILWLQLLDKAADSGQAVVFVTDDSKEDWWAKFDNDSIVGPRHELAAEFGEYSKKSFRMYQSASFLELARERMGGGVSEGAVQELVALKEQDRVERARKQLRAQARRVARNAGMDAGILGSEASRNRRFNLDDYTKLQERLDAIRSEREVLADDLAEMQEQLDRLEAQRASLEARDDLGGQSGLKLESILEAIQARSLTYSRTASRYSHLENVGKNVRNKLAAVETSLFGKVVSPRGGRDDEPWET